MILNFQIDHGRIDISLGQTLHYIASMNWVTNTKGTSRAAPSQLKIKALKYFEHILLEYFFIFLPENAFIVVFFYLPFNPPGHNDFCANFAQKEA